MSGRGADEARYLDAKIVEASSKLDRTPTVVEAPLPVTHVIGGWTQLRERPARPPGVTLAFEQAKRPFTGFQGLLEVSRDDVRLRQARVGIPLNGWESGEIGRAHV